MTCTMHFKVCGRKMKQKNVSSEVANGLASSQNLRWGSFKTYFWNNKNIYCIQRDTNLFNTIKIFKQSNILFHCSKLSQLRKVNNPVFANSVGDNFWKTWVAHQQPSARSDTVGFVLELFRIEFIKVFESLKNEKWRSVLKRNLLVYTLYCRTEGKNKLSS